MAEAILAAATVYVKVLVYLSGTLEPYPSVGF